jgi:hypothetical protein
VPKTPKEFDAKLRATARLLGCRTRKELCARFRDADPATAFQPDRVSKWMQGLSTPREGRAYEEVARLLGLPHGGTWVAECSAAEFVAAAEALAAEPLADATTGPDNSHICADYHCLSAAWSPYFAGQVIRGRLRISSTGSGLAASYTEVMLGREFPYRGPVIASGRGLLIHLREPVAGTAMNISTHLPAHPVSVLAGVASGLTLVGPDTAPACCRFIALRLRGSPKGGPGGYVAPSDGLATADLRALGLAAPEALGKAVNGFLAAGLGALTNRVTWAEQAQLAALADPLHI